MKICAFFSRQLLATFPAIIFLSCLNLASAQSSHGIPDTSLVASFLAKAGKTSSDSSVLIYLQAARLAEEGFKGQTNTTKGKTYLRQMVKANLGIGLVYYQKLEYQKALSYYELAYQAADKLKEPFFLGECLFNFAEVYLEQSRYRDAMDKYNEAMLQYRKAENASGIFWSYSGMGIVQKQSGNFNDAILCYNNALDVASKAGMKYEVAICHNNLGNVYRKLGDFAKAMDAYRKAITTFNALKDELSASDCLNNIGNLYFDNGDPFRALEYYNQSLKLLDVKKDEYRLISRYKNLADAYTVLKDYDNAEQFLEDAVKLAEKAEDKTFLASCYSQLGKLQTAKGSNEIAIAYLKKSANLFHEVGARAEEADALIVLAEAEFSENLLKEATDHAMAGREMASLTGALKTKLTANECLAKCWEKRGDLKQSLKYLNQAMQLKDSIYSVEKNRSIEEIEAGFIQTKLRNENIVLAQNSSLQKQAIRSKNLLVILLIVCLLLSISLIWLIYKRHRETKIKAGRIQKESEKQIEKLSEDLTGKERELTTKTLLINQKNQILEKLIQELEQLKKTDNSSVTIHHLQMELKQELSPNAWKEFEMQFNEVHPGFQQRLMENFPALTPSERRLCSFLRLNMNTREIASLTGQTFKSIEVARTRVRKKLDIPHEQNITNFIALI
jgi:tetratricopeptide (TPR) repeat protein